MQHIPESDDAALEQIPAGLNRGIPKCLWVSESGGRRDPGGRCGRLQPAMGADQVRTAGVLRDRAASAPSSGGVIE